MKSFDRRPVQVWRFRRGIFPRVGVSLHLVKRRTGLVGGKNGSGANCFKCMFLSGERTLQILSGQDSGPNVRSGACFSG